MLNEEHLLHLFMQQNIPLNGRKVAKNVRSSEPVRRVGEGTHNVVARFLSDVDRSMVEDNHQHVVLIGRSLTLDFPRNGGQHATSH